jgi:HEPN domain-containing protein
MSMILSVKDKKRISSARSIEEWEDYLKDGESYLKTAAGAFEKQKNAFTPEILYNIIAMAIEKFIMAVLMRHGELPYNHTMRDLVEAMDTAFPAAIDELREGLLRMDGYQEICDLYGFTIVPPESSEIPGMLNTAEKLRRLVTA